jgi:hypothetical protein
MYREVKKTIIEVYPELRPSKIPVALVNVTLWLLAD